MLACGARVRKKAMNKYNTFVTSKLDTQTSRFLWKMTTSQVDTEFSMLV